MSKILIINGNPKSSSLCQALAESYQQGVTDREIETTMIHLAKMDFDLDLKIDEKKKQTMENCLTDFQTALLTASHIMIIAPVWWGTIPAKLKGLLDRTFLPGFAFAYQENTAMPTQLLGGRTARIIVTMDTPIWYYRWFFGDPIIKTLQKTILEFCGIRVKAISRLGPVITSNDAIRKQWVAQVRNDGINDAIYCARKNKKS